MCNGFLVTFLPETFRPLNHPDDNWQLTGIIPDLLAPARWEDFTEANAPGVEAAVVFFTGSDPLYH